MMKNTFKLALLSAAVIGSPLSFAGTPAHIGGTINFTGAITDTTCTVKVNGTAGATSNVNLPKVSATALAAADDTAGDTPFTVSLSGCKVGGTAISTTNAPKAFLYFEPNANVTPTGTLKNTAPSGAANVDVELMDSNAAPIRIGDPGQLTQQGTTVNASGDTQFPYIVRYHATGLATAGPVTSAVIYDVVYN